MLVAFIVPTQTMQNGFSSNVSNERCEAITQKGTRCKNKALKGSKYCQVHLAKDPRVQQCKARTRKGQRCSRPAKYSGYCKQHYDIKQSGRL